MNELSEQIQAALRVNSENRFRSQRRHFFHVGAWISISLIATATLIGFAANASWILFYFDQPRLHYAIAALLVSASSLLLRSIKLACCGTVLLVANLIIVLPTLIDSTAEMPVEQLSIIHANLGRSQSIAPALENKIKINEPSLLLFQEVTPEFLADATLRFKNYKEQVSEPRTDSRGVAAFVRHDLTNRVSARIVKFASDLTDRPTIELTVDARLRILSFHSKRPQDPRSYRVHAAEFVELANWIMEESNPSIAVGDFNAAPWSARVRELSETTASIVGPQAVATWPSFLGSWGVPIDLVVHTTGVSAGRPELIDVAGSDHKALLVRIRID